MRCEVIHVGSDQIDRSTEGRQLLFTMRHTLSDDGRVHTITWLGRDADGRPVVTVIVRETH